MSWKWFLVWSFESKSTLYLYLPRILIFGGHPELDLSNFKVDLPQLAIRAPSNPNAVTEFLFSTDLPICGSPDPNAGDFGTREVRIHIAGIIRCQRHRQRVSHSTSK